MGSRYLLLLRGKGSGNFFISGQDMKNCGNTFYARKLTSTFTNVIAKCTPKQLAPIYPGANANLQAFCQW